MPNKPSIETSTELSIIKPDFGLSIGASVSKEDILAISVSRYEAEQEEIIEDSRSALKDNEKTGKLLYEGLVKAISEAVANDAKPLFKLTKHLVPFGITPKATASSGNLISETKTIAYSFVFSSDKDSDDSKRGIQASINLARRCPVTKAVTAILESQEELAKDNERLLAKGTEARLKLSKLPSVERQARARIATVMLQKTEEGRALLEDLIK